MDKEKEIVKELKEITKYLKKISRSLEQADINTNGILEQREDEEGEHE